MSRGSDTRERILQKARELFAARGYRGATVAQISRAAGITEGAIYRHFGSKEELLMECIWPAMDTAMAKLAVDDPEITDLESFTRKRLQQRLELFHEHFEAFQIFFSEAYFRPEFMQRFLDDLMQRETTREATDRFLSLAGPARWRNYIVIILGQMMALWGIFRLRQVAADLGGQLPETLATVSDEHLVEDLTRFYLYGFVGVPPAGPDCP